MTKKGRHFFEEKHRMTPTLVTPLNTTEWRRSQ